MELPVPSVRIVVAAALLLLVAYVIIKRRSAGSLMEFVVGPSYSVRREQRQVRKLRNAGKHLEAGRLLEENGKLTEAADVFLEGREYHAAASVLERAGRLERAAELYLQGGDFKKAAQ